jgi:hypothetical protein
MEEQSKQSSTKGQNCRSHKGQVGRSQEADPLAAVGCWEQERGRRAGAAASRALGAAEQLGSSLVSPAWGGAATPDCQRARPSGRSEAGVLARLAGLGRRRHARLPEDTARREVGGRGR